MRQLSGQDASFLYLESPDAHLHLTALYVFDRSTLSGGTLGFEEIVTENDAIRRLRDALDGRSPDETYYERIRLGEAVEKALADKRAHDEEAILSRLRPHVLKTRTNKIISDRMVLNAAFLVDADREPEVDAAVRALDAELGERLMFKYVGPVPPYNFVDIVVSWDARGAA